MIIKRIILLVFVIAFPFLSGNITSRNNYRFHTFSPKGGFYHDGVKSIVQDKEGFIWILMDNNIRRFDGYEYKHYYTAFNHLDSIQQWYFNNIAVNSSGKLYIATNNGLFIYNRIEDSFQRLYSKYINNLAIDKDDNIWLTTGNRLYRYNEQTNDLESPLYEGNVVKNIAHFETNGDNLYLATLYDRIYYCDYKAAPDEISLFYKFPQSYRIIDIKRSANKLWVLVNDHGLFRIDIASKKIDDHFDFQYEYEGENVLAKQIYIDKADKVWIATQQGLLVLNTETRKYDIYRHSGNDSFSLPNNSIWTIAEDSQQNIWIGTFSGGLCYVNIDENLWFKTYTSDKAMLNQNLVSCFAENDNNLWIGTEGGGINRLDKKTGKISYYQHDSKNRNSPSFNNIKYIALDSKENLWISMFRGGLDYFDVKNSKFTHYQKTKGKNSLLSNNLRKIILEKDSGLWIAYQLGKPQISYLSFNDMSFSHHMLDETSNTSYIYDIQKGKDEYLWIVTHQKLYRFNTITHTSEEIRYETEAYLNARSLYIDNENNIWIGTIGKGLLKYDSRKKEFTAFKDVLNFNILTIYSICADFRNCLWLGTDNGLIRYDIEKNDYSRFDETDGLQGQVYYPLACMEGINGELYFGGTNGFTIIYPEKIKQNQFKPNVIISDFLIDNVSTLPAFSENTSRFKENTIVLTHNQANFGFKFSSDNYLIPQKNQFKYRLKGYDDRWITVDANNRAAFYSKVPAGTYQFEVLTANNDGLWNDEPTVIKIRCLPSPWLSWKAYLIYSIIGLIIIGLIVYYYNDKRKLKMQLYLDNLDKQKKEEIHQSQLRFFTNISHDFRTPLSLILATVDNLKQEGIKEYYHRILHNNAVRLLNLVNELMDFRTIENGKMELQVQSVDINPFVRELSLDFEDYAKKHHINFDIVLDPQLAAHSIYVDKHILEKIIMNLLNNAFKYTKDGGRISIETYINKDDFKSVYGNSYTVASDTFTDNSFSIVIRDTGIGITKASIKSVFERFYKVKTANADMHLGTGIGLALVKSLVLLHKGEISLFSEREQGTDIVVNLPLEPNVYTANERFDAEADSKQMAVTDSLTENKKELKSTSHNIPPIENILLRNKKRVLLVEDNDDLRTLIANFLSTTYDINEASNGVEAIEILEDVEVDLIISDIMMPLKDGVTLLKEVKSNVNTSHIPFILLTAKTELGTKLESTESGADLYFEKPIDFNLLLLSVHNIFVQRQKLREYYSKNFYAGSTELSTNERDNSFLKKLIEIIDINLNSPNIDVNYIASELAMSRSKLYSKVKMITGKSIVEFILQYKLRKAARMLIEQDLPIYQIMAVIGIRSQSYFTTVFKKEFEETPSSFAAKYKKRKDSD